MFLVTNREIRKNKGGTEVLGKNPNTAGPNELRLVEATKRAGKWSLTVLPDEATPAMKQSVGMTRGDDSHIAAYAAHKILEAVNPRAIHPRSRKRGKNLLVFVHGYNNDVEDVLERSRSLARIYGLEVLPFSWPANGGGLISGVPSYKSDKRDAKISIGALDRTLLEIARRLDQLTARRLEKIRREAANRHRDNKEAQDALISRALQSECPFTINLLAHSMGNYLYKHLLLSSASEGTTMLFDNVVLAAADANNEDHARWVDQIRCRRRVYITINEDDFALRASRLKSGEEQRARLGHYPFNLHSRHAAYVQFTGAAHVGNSHAYFADGALENPRVKRFFRRALHGERADRGLAYDAGSNTYRV
jgi:esterase/lipase superfamily enzyme